MTAREAMELFARAKGLFGEGNVQQALSILDAIDRAYPGQKNLVKAKAQCLDRLGRTQESQPLWAWVRTQRAEAGETSADIVDPYELRELLRPTPEPEESPLSSAFAGLQLLELQDLVKPVVSVRKSPVRPSSGGLLRYAVVAAAALAVVAGGTVLAARLSGTPEAEKPVVAEAPPEPAPAVEPEPPKPVVELPPMAPIQHGPIRLKPEPLYSAYTGVPTTLSQYNFDAFTADGVVLVDFWAPWCGPCRAMAPVVDQVAAEFQGRVKVGKVNTEIEKGLARRFSIDSIPTFFVIRDGQLLTRFAGGVPKSELTRLLSEACQ